MKKTFTLIGVGIVNVLHAGLHLVQSFQSFYILSTDVHFGDSLWSLVLAGVGIYSLAVGYQDFQHHRKCHKNNIES